MRGIPFAETSGALAAESAPLLHFGKETGLSTGASGRADPNGWRRDDGLMNLPHEIQKRGGLAATHQLLRAGATSRLLTAAVRRGEIIRIRQGWYGLPAEQLHRAEAVRVGGRLTCVSAALQHGLH